LPSPVFITFVRDEDLCVGMYHVKPYTVTGHPSRPVSGLDTL
jgi:hypothetical protein